MSSKPPLSSASNPSPDSKKPKKESSKSFSAFTDDFLDTDEAQEKNSADTSTAVSDHFKKLYTDRQSQLKTGSQAQQQKAQETMKKLSTLLTLHKVSIDKGSVDNETLADKLILDLQSYQEDFDLPKKSQISSPSTTPSSSSTATTTINPLQQLIDMDTSKPTKVRNAKIDLANQILQGIKASNISAQIAVVNEPQNQDKNEVDLKKKVDSLNISFTSLSSNNATDTSKTSSNATNVETLDPSKTKNPQGVTNQFNSNKQNNQQKQYQIVATKLNDDDWKKFVDSVKADQKMLDWVMETKNPETEKIIKFKNNVTVDNAGAELQISAPSGSVKELTYTFRKALSLNKDKNSLLSGTGFENPSDPKTFNNIANTILGLTDTAPPLDKLETPKEIIIPNKTVLDAFSKSVDPNHKKAFGIYTQLQEQLQKEQSLSDSHKPPSNKGH